MTLVFIANNLLFPQLERLSVSHCNISINLPDDFFGDKLKHLKVLYLLDNNDITTLPASITNLTSTCTHFDIDGNPLQNPPMEVAEKGIEAINRFFSEMLDYGYHMISNQQKLMLVGN